MMKKYDFIDPDGEYDGEKLWERFGATGAILQDHYECTEKIRAMTGNIFRTEEDKQKQMELMEKYITGKENMKKMFSDIGPEKAEQLKGNFMQIIEIANIQKAASNGNSFILSMINSIVSFGIKRAKFKSTDGSDGKVQAKEAKNIILSSHLLVKAGVSVYNNLLASLAIAKFELRRLELVQQGVITEDMRFVWDHNGQRISFPYAVACLMADTDYLKYSNTISEAIDIFSGIMNMADEKAKEEFGVLKDSLQKGIDNVFADIREIYGNFSREEIESQAALYKDDSIFSFLKFSLPDEETVALVMEGEYDVAERLLSYKAGEKTVPAEEIYKKYGYDRTYRESDDDIEL